MYTLQYISIEPILKRQKNTKCELCITNFIRGKVNRNLLFASVINMCQRKNAADFLISCEDVDQSLFNNFFFCKISLTSLCEMRMKLALGILAFLVV